MGVVISPSLSPTLSLQPGLDGLQSRVKEQLWFTCWSRYKSLKAKLSAELHSDIAELWFGVETPDITCSRLQTLRHNAEVSHTFLQQPSVSKNIWTPISSEALTRGLDPPYVHLCLWAGTPASRQDGSWRSCSARSQSAALSLRSWAQFTESLREELCYNQCVGYGWFYILIIKL